MFIVTKHQNLYKIVTLIVRFIGVALFFIGLIGVGADVDNAKTEVIVRLVGMLSMVISLLIMASEED
jgi:hypothetical protein